MIVLLVGMPGLPYLFAQEGTKQLIPGPADRLFIEVYGEGSNFATYIAEKRERLNIYLKTGEKIHFGMKMASANGNASLTTFRIKDPSNAVVFPQTAFPVSATDVGFIADRPKAVAGPNGTILNGTAINNGYTPFVYTATSTGDHYIEFQTWQDAGFTIFQRRQSWLEFFDATVTDGSNNIMTNPGEPTRSAGRLWSRQWALTTTNFTSFPVQTDFFIYTADGFVNKVNYEMLPFGFIFVSNTFGVKQTADAFENRRSAPGNAFINDVSEHQIFLNNPDISVFPNSTVQPVVKIFFNNVLIYDYDFSRLPQEITLSPGVITIDKNDDSCPHNSIATFKILSNINSQIQVAFDLDGNNDGFTPGGADRVLYADIVPGENYMIWDLKDGQGNIQANGGAFEAEMVFLLGGITHFPLFDVEGLNSVTTEAVRPFPRPNPTLYWDDQNIALPPSSLTLSSGSAITQLQSGVFVERKWAFSGSASSQNNGNLNTMNSWFSGLELQTAFQYRIVQTGICKNNDHDQDEILDLIDIDDDNDGLPDLTECPEGTDPGQDDDDDGIPNYQDTNYPGFVDSNNDGVHDVFDRDQDGVPDFFDLDSDNDGIMDVIEGGGSDPDHNGIIGNITITDTDLDGLEDSVDPQVFGSSPGTPLAYPDTDFDGIPNAEDADSDSDGIPDNREGQTTPGYIAPLSANPTDTDADGLNDAYDIFYNLYTTVAPFQSYGDPIIGGTPILPVNTDLADQPDFIEADSDNDLTPDWIEGFDDNENGTTAEDLFTRAANYETANANPGHYPNSDLNANNIPDWAEDTDLDGLPDYLDPNALPTYRDSDQDGLIDLYDESNNGKGYGSATASFQEPDNDNDNAPNYRDTDTKGCIQVPLTTFTGIINVCVGGNLSLTADESNAQSYIWRKGTTTIATTRVLLIPNVSLQDAANDYSLEVSNGSCSLKSSDFAIQVFDAPDLGFSGDTSLCEGDTLRLTANQETAVSYTWTKDGATVGNSRTLLILHVSAADASNAYILEIDNGSCQKESDSIQVSVDVRPLTNLSLSADTTTLCENNQGIHISITNSESGVSYQLLENVQPIGQVFLGTGGVINLPTGAINTVGLHTFRVKALRGSCQEVLLEDSIQINIEALPRTDLSLSADNLEVCNDNTGITIQLENSEPGVSYQLNLEGTPVGNPQNGTGNTLTFATGTITVLGNINFTISASRGTCIAIPLDSSLVVSSADSVDVSVVIVSVIGENGNGICGGSAEFIATATNAGNNPSYEWFVNGVSAGVGGANFDLSGLNEGDKVSTRLTSSLPCTNPVSSNEVTVVSLPPLDIDIEADITEGVPGCILTIKASGAQSYTWEPLSAIVSLTPFGDEIKVSPAQTTTFIVTGTDPNGCTGQDSVTITIVPEEEIFIPTLFSPNGDDRNDTFLVHGECIKEITLRVFDRAGNLVYEANTVEQATKIGWDGTHQGADQPMGKYLWTIEGKSTTGQDLKFEGKTRGLINLFR
ncbi:MAG: gliding motility-associated C-terminal domain-containing protein [Microscillaceae bacterium]|nr:gliding motility-associated C-terminal domain-containing protein [Microscillaceae bacterium]